MKHSGYLEGFPERFQQLIFDKDINCVQLAERIGYERKSIYSWKQGETCPNILALARICKLFNVSADYLLFGEDNA